MKRPLKIKTGEDYYIRKLLKATKLKDVMAVPCISIKVNAPFKQVPQKLSEFQIRHLPVVNDKNKLVGLITQRDLYKIKSPRKLMDGRWFYDEDLLKSIILSHVMVRDPVAMHPEDSLAEALTVMARKKYGCIPIVDKKKILRGIITQIDILKVADQILSE